MRGFHTIEISRSIVYIYIYIYIYIYFFFCIVHIYPPFTRKQIVLLYFGREVRTRLGVAISEMSGAPVFHIKAGAFR